ncbi:MAG: glycoside hydrolase family 130 protein [Phycisphaerae bacterium]
MLERFGQNPLIGPGQVWPSRDDFEVVGVFNAGAVRVGDEVVLLVRVAERPRQIEPGWAVSPVLDLSGAEPAIRVLRCRRDDPDFRPIDARWFCYRGRVYLTSMSHLRLARSRDARDFEVDRQPALGPMQACEEFGLEDPRITPLEGRYWITYTAVSRHGIATALASTSDFVSFECHGVIFAPENRDVTIFPARFGRRYACHHRPVPSALGQPDIWLAWSQDLLHWGEHAWVMGARPGRWDGGRIGAGSVPIRTDRGWLVIYHGADEKLRYYLAAALLDADDPGRVLARSSEPLLTAQAEYEKHGFFDNVVFACGAIADGDMLSVYYGAADCCLAGAEGSISAILDSLEPA